MPQTILYYPNININDGAWLRNAVLYWDEVSSIVPYEGYANLSNELLYLKNYGVYSPIYPTKILFSDKSNDFCNLVKRRINAYERTLRRQAERQVAPRMRREYAPGLYSLIHYEKMPQTILDYFKQKRFYNEIGRDGFIEIDEKIAQIYMRTLAEFSIKCSDKDIVLGTDNIYSNREIYQSAFDANRVNTQCCKINLLNCLPQPTNDISFEDILLFKEKRKDELSEVRKKIRELEAQIYTAESVEQIIFYENCFIDNWREASSNYEKVLKASKITYGMSSLCSIIALQFVGNVMAEKLGANASQIIQAGAQIVNIGITYLRYKDKVSPNKSAGGFSYIIQADSEGIININ